MQKKIGQIAIEKGWITPEERDEILRIQQGKRRNGEVIEDTLFGKLLEEEGLVSSSVVLELLDSQHHNFRQQFETLITTGENFLFAEYVVEKFIARGAMGFVYQVSSSSGKRMAMKIMNLNKISEKLKRRFHREIEILSRLSHPNIVRIIDWGEKEGIDYLVMEYLEGKTFEQAIASNISYRVWCQKFLPLLDAIDKIHEEGILHRDLKPQNIIYTDEGQLVILDFGLGKIKDEDSSLSSVGMLGTPSYMAPEQAIPTMKKDQQTDIWALGVIMYQFVTKKLPFEENKRIDLLNAICHKPMPSPQLYNPEIPDSLAIICEKALAKDKKERYQKIREMIFDLEKVMESELENSYHYSAGSIKKIRCASQSNIVSSSAAAISEQKYEQRLETEEKEICSEKPLSLPNITTNPVKTDKVDEHQDETFSMSDETTFPKEETVVSPSDITIKIYEEHQTKKYLGDDIDTKRREKIYKAEIETKINRANYKKQPALPSDYEYIKLISSGGQGSVWLAKNTNMHRHEAVKVLSYLGDIEMERFQKEIQYMASLNHNNIATIYYANPKDAYFIMEYLPQGSFIKIVKDNTMPLEEKIRLLKEVLRGLAFAHEKGLIHRDLKPGNILFSDEMTPKITDFGLAKIDTQNEEAKSNSIFGTPSYMAPEQWENSRDVTYLCDLWAIGIMLYEIIKGNKPFSHLSHYELMYQTISISQSMPSPFKGKAELTSEEKILESICNKALQKKESERYQSAQEIMDDLTMYLGDEPSIIQHNVYQPPPKTKSKILMILGLISLFAYFGYQFQKFTQMKKEFLQLSTESSLESWEMFLVRYKNQILYTNEDEVMRNQVTVYISKIKEKQALIKEKQLFWNENLQNMEDSFEQIVDNQEDLRQKIELWKKFMATFALDNPSTEQDEQMREKARKYIEEYTLKIDMQKWLAKSQKMKNSFREINDNSHLSLEQKIASWEKFLTNFNSKNPHTDKDYELYLQATENLKKLVEQKKVLEITEQTNKKEMQYKLKKMQQVFATLADNNYDLAKNVLLWKRFLQEFIEDIPETNQDDVLRTKAQDKLISYKALYDIWVEKIKEMQNLYEELQNQDASVADWQKFIMRFSENNPLTTKDDEMIVVVKNHIQQLEDNKKYNITIISQDQKILKEAQVLLENKNFSVELLQVKCSENSIVYYTIKHPEPEEFTKRIMLLKKWMENYKQQPFSIDKKKLTNREFEIKIKIK